MIILVSPIPQTPVLVHKTYQFIAIPGEITKSVEIQRTKAHKRDKRETNQTCYDAEMVIF